MQVQIRGSKFRKSKSIDISKMRKFQKGGDILVDISGASSSIYTKVNNENLAGYESVSKQNLSNSESKLKS